MRTADEIARGMQATAAKWTHMPAMAFKTSDVLAVLADRDALKAEVLDQARLNGMGAERELALRARITKLERALTEIRDARYYGAAATSRTAGNPHMRRGGPS